MHQDNWVDISFESFNQCGGSCPSCNLTIEERNSEQFHLEQIKTAVGHLKNKNWSSHHRLFLTYGDYPLLKELPEVAHFLNNEKIAFGFTGTFVLPTEYYDNFFKIQKSLGYSLIDIIIDPFRMQHSPYYVNTLKKVVSEIPPEKLHLTTLISKALLQKFSPHELSELMVANFGETIVVPNALPTLFAINGKNGAQFEITETLQWLKDYYMHHPNGKLHLRNELHENYQSEGDFLDCLKHIYHLDSELNIYAVSNTIMGDFIYDRKNNYEPLGNLGIISNWKELINSPKAQKINIISALQIDTNSECESCSFTQSCKFFGVGNIMKSYAKYSKKSNYCYGPKFFELKKP